MNKTDFIKEFEDKFVGDNWKYGIGYLAWEQIKPWLEIKYDEIFGMAHRIGYEKDKVEVKQLSMIS